MIFNIWSQIEYYWKKKFLLEQICVLLHIFEINVNKNWVLLIFACLPILFWYSPLPSHKKFFQFFSKKLKVAASQFPVQLTPEKTICLLRNVIRDLGCEIIKKINWMVKILLKIEKYYWKFAFSIIFLFFWLTANLHTLKFLQVLFKVKIKQF